MSLVSRALAFVQYTYLNTYRFDRNADSSIVQLKNFWPVEYSNLWDIQTVAKGRVTNAATPS